MLILLSDIDGFCTDDPNMNKDAKLISYVDKISNEILDMAKSTTGADGNRRYIKLSAAKIATASGADMVICNGDNVKISIVF